jgi:hypothetical protein
MVVQQQTSTNFGRLNMNYEIENLIKQSADQIPKAGFWLFLKNVQLLLEILFETIRQLLSLGLVLVVLWYVFQLMPSIDSIKTILGS